MTPSQTTNGTISTTAATRPAVGPKATYAIPTAMKTSPAAIPKTGSTNDQNSSLSKPGTTGPLRICEKRMAVTTSS